MRRFVILAMLAAVLLGAGTASAGIYASMRLAGTGNYFTWDGPTGRDYVYDFLWDSGFECYKEVAVGFGDKIQGEVSLGYDNLKYDMEWDETRSNDTETDTYTTMRLGAAGFYPLAEGKSWRMDAGLRFQYQSANTEIEWTSGDVTTTDTYRMSGWSVGPVLRHRWMIADGAMSIGPEIYPKYTSFSTESEHASDARASTTEAGPDITALDIEYSLRMDFYFD